MIYDDYYHCYFDLISESEWQLIAKNVGQDIQGGNEQYAE